MGRALRAIPFITSFFAHEPLTWGTPRDAEPFTSSILVQESAFPMLRAGEKTMPPAASQLRPWQMPYGLACQVPCLIARV